MCNIGQLDLYLMISHQFWCLPMLKWTNMIIYVHPKPGRRVWLWQWSYLFMLALVSIRFDIKSLNTGLIDLILHIWSLKRPNNASFGCKSNWMNETLIPPRIKGFRGTFTCINQSILIRSWVCKSQNNFSHASLYIETLRAWIWAHFHWWNQPERWKYGKFGFFTIFNF